MSIDFGKAAKRHLRDGQRLQGWRLLESADQLFGFAAECALKAALLELQVRKDPEDVPYVHVDRLWGQFQSLVSGRSGAVVASYLGSRNPFSDWSTEQRYWAGGKIAGPVAAKHEAAASRTLQLLEVLKSRGASR